ncbi:MAG: hypothetical protein AAFQ58_13630 [Pseudomonadota bacterium]
MGVASQAALAWAEALPMASRASLLVSRAPMIEVTDAQPRPGPSLFAGIRGNSVLAPPPPRIIQARALPRQLQAQPDGTLRLASHVSAFSQSALARPAPYRLGDGPLSELRSLIAKAEAGKAGYDAVQYGADIKPSGRPTTLTIQQIYDWIDATPGQPHAIGRYQFIPPTLRRLVTQLDLSPRARFTPDIQDRLADLLLAEAGLQHFLTGQKPRHAFMNNLAKIWAGLPNDTGQSHYHGYAGNKATMSWAYFDAQMARIFPG